MPVIPESALNTPLTVSGITIAHCARPDLARGLCTAAAVTLLPFMPSGTRIISARGYRGDTPPAWTDRPLDSIVHTALLTPDNEIMDWTARQFWPGADFPSITPLDAYRRVWSTITIINPPSESHRP